MEETESAPADMVTLLQLQDAIANRELVDNRVESVGLRVMKLLQRQEPKYGQWRLRSYRINMRDLSEERKHIREANVRAVFGVPWSGRPATPEYGDPTDYPDGDEFRTSQEEFLRHVEFPHRYLLTEGWEDEVLRKLQWESAYYRNLHLEGRAKRVADLEAELAEAREKLERETELSKIDKETGVLERHWLDDRP